MIFWLLASLFFIALQGLFSGLETGLVSILRPRAEHAAKISSGRGSARILFFLNHPGLMISTALVGVNISVVLASLSVKNFTECCGLSGGAGIALSTSVLSVIFLVAEIIPKDWFRQAPYRRCVQAVFVLHAAYLLLWPLVRIFTALTDILNRKTAGDAEPRDRAMREDLRLFIRESEGYGALDPGTAGILHHVLTLPNLQLRDLCEPWKKTPVVSPSDTIREAFQTASAHGGAGKLPVCEGGSTGKCVGAFDAYDAIVKIPEALWDTEKVFSCMGKIHILRETDGISPAIELSRRERVLLFLIVDPSGARAGTLSPERIAEHLFE